MTWTFPRSQNSSSSPQPPSYHSAPGSRRYQRRPQLNRGFMTDPIRDPSILHSGDRSSFNAVGRAMTRNSHYSQPTSVSGVTASTRSWVYSTQQNPPPPPEETQTPLSSPLRTPRPLPDPQYQGYLYPPQSHIPTLHPAHRLPQPVDDDEEEYMQIDAHAPGMRMGHITEGLGYGRTPADAINSSRGNLSSGGRSFVGGFVSTIRRLPKVVLKFKTVGGGKRQYIRRQTGTEGTVTDGTDAGQTTGSTLPKYVSNESTPVAGPSNPRYQESFFRMPVPIILDDPSPEPLPDASLGPSLSQRRRRPGFRISPPSDVMEQDETISYNHTPAPVTRNSDVTIYNIPQSDEFGYTGSVSRPATGMAGTETHSIIPPSVMTATPNRLTMTDAHTQSHHQGPSSHASHLVANPPVVSSPPVQSPVLAHPQPTSDYRKMNVSRATSPSAQPTSTVSSEPSFASQRNPIRRFFHALYHLPWIAPDRVTVDYRPLGRGRTVIGKESKKHNPSWYRGNPGVVLSGSEKLDLLSSAASNRASTLGSILRYRPSGHRRHHHRHHRNHDHHGHRDHHHHHSRHRRRRRTVVSSTNASTAEPQHPPQHTASPIIPTVYPYAYPITYAYPTFQSASPLMQHLPPPTAIQQPQQIHRTQSATMPRGPRPAPTGPVYPHGYTPYQHPPPTYVISHGTPPAQGSPAGGPLGDVNDPGAGAGVGQPMQVPVYMQMQLVPGGMPPTPPPLMATASLPGLSVPPGPVAAAVLQQA